MVKCVVQGCPNRKDKGKDTGTTNKRFFSFPQDPGRVKVWLAALRETDRDPSELNEICEDHFLADHITPQGISEDAIPLPPYLDGPLGASESSEGEQEEGGFSVAPIDTDDDVDDDDGDEEVEYEEEEEEEGLIQENGVEDVQKPQTSQESNVEVPKPQTDADAPKEREMGRCDVSLGRLTHLFMRLLSEAPDGVLDLKEAALKLGTRKRRVYDITNVLNGIRLIQKKSTNKVQWVGSTPISSFSTVFRTRLKEEVQSLRTMEEALDNLIKDCAKQLFALTDDKENAQVAYVTHEDLSHIQVFQGQTLITVQAPEETKLDVPMPRVDGINMHLKGTRGTIHVMTCEMDFPGIMLNNANLEKPGRFQSLEESRIHTASLKTDSTSPPGPVQSA
ncbi:transcription factor E2F6 [Alosa alosa]|uniref:transcription factor E2F6 n=1 Tax=Alosa alosa TaxID=278164 RepID=UPI0020150A38|nr:transcription factor E2F6 [Alosa alosa]